ncbi:hypothetical protein [Actinoplanes sp. NPDC026619]|uniref:hypothetical protein n=1 Tax=Actinoplanes sp. NPDC026619 TaxID=3155798 RepID=UPI0033E971E4
MAVKDRPAWTGWAADWTVRYLWRPRHSRDDGPRELNRRAVVVLAVVVLAVGAAAYAVFRGGDDDRQPAAGVTLPTASLIMPGGDYASIPVSVLPAPATSTATFSAPPVPSTAAAPPAATSKKTTTPVRQERTIAATSVLNPGESWSTNRLRLTLTARGNLVLQDQGRTVWQTGTTTGAKLVMQNDGHLVLYDAGNANVWSSKTPGNPGAVLILRADGNMVIALNGRVLFQTGTGD